MRIALCDDERLHIEQISKVLDDYRHAFDYLMKPVNKEDLFCTLNDIYAQKTSRKNDSLTVTFAK